MKARLIIPLLIIALVLMVILFKPNKVQAGTMAKSYLGANATRGIKNNNPLNIRRSGNTWKGKIPHSQSTDTAFEQFENWVYGVRAAIKNLHTHYKRGKNTIRTIVHVWAPPVENDTSAYVTHVANRTGISADSPFAWNQATVRKIVQAMAIMETAKDVVTDEDFDAAWSLV